MFRLAVENLEYLPNYACIRLTENGKTIHESVYKCQGEMDDVSSVMRNFKSVVDIFFKEKSQTEPDQTQKKPVKRTKS